eukprot:1738389-Rhodomonas_salina.2
MKHFGSFTRAFVTVRLYGSGTSTARSGIKVWRLGQGTGGGEQGRGKTVGIAGNSVDVVAAAASTHFLSPRTASALHAQPEHETSFAARMLQQKGIRLDARDGIERVQMCS